MSYLFQKLGLNDEQLQKIVARTATSILMLKHTEPYNPEMPLAERKKLANDFLDGLEFLQESDIIKYEIRTYMGEHSLFSVTVTNRYNLMQLIAELDYIEYHVGVKESDFEIPQLESTAYYDRSTGRIIINGARKILKNTNKKLLDALFRAHPDYATRSSLLSLIGSKKRERSAKIALNEAFSNLRKACGVTSETIGLGKDGGTLNAKTHQLTDEDAIYFSNYHTD